MNTVKEAIVMLSPFIILGIVLQIILLSIKGWINGLKYKHVKVTYTPTSLKEMFSDYQRYSQRAFNLMNYSLHLPEEALVKDRIEREIIWLSMQADNVTDCIKDRMCDP